jgi:hypothetical protein
MKSLACCREIFCSDKNLRAATIDKPRVLLAGVVSANHRINPCGLERTARELGFYPRWKYCDRDQVGHALSLPQSTVAEGQSIARPAPLTRRRVERNSQTSHEPGQRRANPFRASLKVVVHMSVDVTQTVRCVKAVRDFGERRFRDIQKPDAVSNRSASDAFDDVGWNRIGGPSNLGRQFVALVRRVGRSQSMNVDEQVIRALPGNQLLVLEGHDAASCKLRARS